MPWLPHWDRVVGKDEKSLSIVTSDQMKDKVAICLPRSFSVAKYGIVPAKGPSRLAAEGPAAVADALLSELARELFADLFKDDPAFRRCMPTRP